MNVKGIKWINLILILAVLGGYHRYAGVHQEKMTEASKASKSNESAWKDGSYEGSGNGFGGQIRVRVTVADGEITDVKILSAKKETKEYLNMAKKLLTDIREAQSPEVDVVSGATYSSNGIKEAVRKALEEANE